MFQLHPQLAEDCILLGDFPLTRVLLNKDANYPWFILVPKREEIREIYQLSEADQQQLLWESSYFSRQIHDLFQADKLNVAALGNMVPQLHVHHIVRYKKDVAWPAPVWGHVAALEYDAGRLDEVCEGVRDILLEQFKPLY
ncbi:MAG: HIT domain-containing protein [Pseudomonadales bacterium]